MTVDDQRWHAVQTQAASSDAEFVYAVTTTGVFCRPSCPSRRPLREHVRFFDRIADAEAAGFRACLRCQPKGPGSQERAAEMVRQACAQMRAHVEAAPTYVQLSHRAGVSAAYFHRTFKAQMGVTPKQYAAQLRVGRWKKALRKGANVTQSIYIAGYGSSSRAYESKDAQLGMTPRQYRAGGEGVQITYACVETAKLGGMMMAATDRGLCFLQFGESEDALLLKLQQEFPLATLSRIAEPAHPQFALWLKAIEGYLAGQLTTLQLPLDLRATAFQMRVWNYLQQIPYGETRSYSKIAEDLEAPRSSRAVAGACAANRVALLIPCHRVLRNNGELGGFRWGLERKRALLNLEEDAATLQAPKRNRAESDKAESNKAENNKGEGGEAEGKIKQTPAML